MDAHSRGKRGQSLVELALLLPFLLWVCAGIVDFGRVYYYQVAAINAARSGARVGAVVANTETNIRDAVKADALGNGMLVTDAQIGISVAQYGPAHPPASTRWAGDDVTVTVTYRFTPITPLIDRAVGGTLTVTRATTMKVLY